MGSAESPAATGVCNDVRLGDGLPAACAWTGWNAWHSTRHDAYGPTYTVHLQRPGVSYDVKRTDADRSVCGGVSAGARSRGQPPEWRPALPTRGHARPSLIGLGKKCDGRSPEHLGIGHRAFTNPSAIQPGVEAGPRRAGALFPSRGTGPLHPWLRTCRPWALRPSPYPCRAEEE